MIALLVAATLITGTVNPPGATVQAYDAGGTLAASAPADAAGHYSLSVASGRYHLLAFDPNGVYATTFYADAESFDTSALIDATSNLSNINMNLVRAGYVSGVVTTTSGTPLPSMTVAAYNLDGTRRGFTTTDANGRYQLVLPPGTFDIAAYDDALVYLVTVTHGSVVGTSSTTTDDFRLTKTAVVSGVIDDTNGAPLASMSVSFYANGALVTTATTDATGHYRVSVAPATYRIVTFDPAGVFAPSYFANAESFDTSTPLSLAEGSAASASAVLVRAGNFTGRITDATTHAALAGITVAAYNDDGTTRAFTNTDGSGAYVLVVPPNAYRIGAYDTNLQYVRRFYPNATTFATAPSWSTFPSTATPIDLALPRGASVSGQVTSAGTTLAGITVAAYDANGIVASAVSDANGMYRLLLDSGTYVLAAFDPAFRYATSSAQIATVAGNAMTDNFSLVAGAHLSGIVTSDLGLPLASMTVAAYDGSGNVVASAITRSDGRFDFVVPPGSYRVSAFDPLLHYAPSPLTAAASYGASDVISTLTFALQPNVIPHRRAARH